MAIRPIATVCLLSLSAATALRLPAKPPNAQPHAAVSRRAALGAAALAALQAGRASAYDYSQGSENFSYKTREYSSSLDYETKKDASKKLECPEGQRATPDGFGGRKCTGKVKGVTQLAAEKATEILTGEAPAPAAAPAAVPKAAPAAKKAAPPPPPPTPSKPLSMDELIANSIKQKAELLGRDLTDAEKADMTAKVKKLMQ